MAEWSCEIMAGNKKVTLKLENVSKSFAKIENDEVTHALHQVSVTMQSGLNSR